MADQGHLKKLNEGVTAWNKWREECPEIFPDLRKADLHGRILTGIDFRRTNLDNADLSNANLCSASLKFASLCQTNLSGAKLRNAFLCGTCFKETILQRTNFYKAALLETTFLNVDLKETINLETTVHLGPSTIGIDTIQRSGGNIPEAFLIGVGVSEQLHSYIHSLGHTPFDYYTCFISYANQDQHFVEILCQDLRKAGGPIRWGRITCVFVLGGVEVCERATLSKSNNTAGYTHKHGQRALVPSAHLYLNGVLRRACLTSRSPALVSCQPGKRTMRTISSISLTTRSTITGVFPMRASLNSSVKAALPFILFLCLVRLLFPPEQPRGRFREAA